MGQYHADTYPKIYFQYDSHPPSWICCDVIILNPRTVGASGYAASVGIIAAGFCYTLTDSHILTEITNLLLALKQQGKYIVGGVAYWLECWSRPENFPYPAPDC